LQNSLSVIGIFVSPSIRAAEPMMRKRVLVAHSTYAVLEGTRYAGLFMGLELGKTENHIGFQDLSVYHIRMSAFISAVAFAKSRGAMVHDAIPG
jgi:hypothetical protein